MTDMLTRKRQALEALLHEMEMLDDALGGGHFEEFDAITARQEAVVRELATLDREIEGAGRSRNYPRAEVEELKALVARITEINSSLMVTAADQSREVQQELGALRRRVEATAGYRKQANVKI